MAKANTGITETEQNAGSAGVGEQNAGSAGAGEQNAGSAGAGEQNTGSAGAGEQNTGSAGAGAEKKAEADLSKLWLAASGLWIYNDVVLESEASDAEYFAQAKEKYGLKASDIVIVNNGDAVFMVGVK